MGNKRIKEVVKDSSPTSELSEREFKVRIVERLGHLESRLTSKFANSGSHQKHALRELHLESMSLEMLDTVCREFTISILRKIVGKFKEDGMGPGKAAKILDERDQHGYALIHYFCYVNYE